MKTEHTKGPWKSIVPPSSTFVHRFITTDREDGCDLVVAEVGGKYSATDEEISIFEHVANARLIASAPDLLDALRQAVVVMESIAQTHGYDISIGVVPQARAAIARAEGRAET